MPERAENSRYGGGRRRITAAATAVTRRIYDELAVARGAWYWICVSKKCTGLPAGAQCVRRAYCDGGGKLASTWEKRRRRLLAGVGL